MGGKAGTGPDIRLEPAWKKWTSSNYRNGCVRHGSNDVVKMNLKSLGLDGPILLCKSCGSYSHLMAECPVSWEYVIKSKASKGNVKSVDQSNKKKIMGEIELRGVIDQLQLM